MKQRVYQWMRRRLVTVAPDDPVYLAVERMAEDCLRHVLVVDDAHKLCGILSNRDLIRIPLCDPDGRLDLHGLPVARIMTPAPLATVHPHAPLKAAAQAMALRKISALPVVLRGRLTGVITSHDLLMAWDNPAPLQIEEVAFV